MPYFLFRLPTSFAQFSVIFVLSKTEDEFTRLSKRAHRHEDSKQLGHCPITINPSLNTPNNNAVDCKETIRDAQWSWLESSSCVVEREREREREHLTTFSWHEGCNLNLLIPLWTLRRSQEIGQLVLPLCQPLPSVIESEMVNQFLYSGDAKIGGVDSCIR